MREKTIIVIIVASISYFLNYEKIRAAIPIEQKIAI